MSAPVLDLVTARRWAVTARLALAGARERIDALNVFPVADGDTGTNMYLTIDGSLEFVRGQFELGAGTGRLDQGLALIARGMLLAARGNSGIILAQLTRGLAEAVGPDVEVAGPADLAEAFETAAQTAWDALAEPVEGTILTVARAAAEGARAAVDRGEESLDVLQVVSEALEGARQALARTPQQLPALEVAGVVDAGGAGLVLVIEALEAVLEERPHLTVDDLPDWWEVPVDDDADDRGGAGCRDAGTDGGPTGDAPGTGRGTSTVDADGTDPACAAGAAASDGDGEVEVMYLLTGTDPTRADRLRAHLARIGSSVVVAGGPTDYRVHVHLDDPRLAVEAGTFAGLVEHVRLTSLEDGRELDASLDAEGSRVGSDGTGQADPPPLTVVACGLGDGVLDLLASAGAQVVPSGPRQRASAGQLLAAMWASGSPHIVVLPNDSDTVMVANAAAQEAAREGLRVDVIPTGTLVQGIAALAVLDPSQPGDEVVRDMTEAARGCRSGALTQAERDADTPVGPCRVGQWLGIVDHGIVAVGDDLDPVATTVLDLLWHDGAEVLTVVTGSAGSAEQLAPVLGAHEGRHPGIEVLRIDGGQPTYPYLLGVE